MRIITFDTCLDKMYLTLSEKGKVLISKMIENTADRYHSACLIPTIAEILQKNNLTMQDIQAVGVNIGPGSFTGIRACLTVARVMGQSLDIPVVGIPSLEIIAGINKTEKNSIVILDARKQKAYVSIYSSDLEIKLSPRALDLEEALEMAKDDYFVIADKKMEILLNDKSVNCINYQNSDFDFGLNLASLTFKYLEKASKGEYNWNYCKPLYIQPPPISMPKKVQV